MSLSDILFLLLVPLAGLAWYRFDLAVLAILALLPTYLLRLAVVGISTTWLELAIYILFVVFLVQGKWRGHNWLKIKSRRLWLIPVGLWLVAAIVAVFIAPDKRLALGILKGWIIDPVLLIYLFITELNLAPIKEKYWQETVRVFWLGGVVTSFGSMIMAVLNQTTRVYGWYDSPNVLAMYLTPLLLLSILWSFSRIFKSSFSYVAKVIWWLGIGIIFLALIGSNSYTGLISLLVSLLVFVLLTKFNYRGFTVGLGVVLLLGSVLLPLFFVKYDYWLPLSHYNDKYQLNSGQVRLVLWREAMTVIRERPIQGLGLGQWQPYFLKQIRPRLPEARKPGFAIELYYASLFPHNLFLTTWLYLGLGGFMALIWLIIKSFLVAARKKNLAIPLAVLVSILVLGLVDTPLFKNDWAVMYWLLLSVFFWYDDQPALPSSS